MGIPFPITHWQTANAPQAGYALWLNPTYRPGTAFQDAARTTVANVGDPVGGLYDPTNGITATATGLARPVRGATGLTFAGAQWLDLSSAVITKTALIIARHTLLPANVASGTYLLGRNDSAPTSLFGYDQNGGIRIYATSGGYFATPTYATVYTVLGMFAIRESSLAVSLWWQSAKQAGTITIGSVFTPNVIGRFTSGRYHYGEIREVLLYSTALTDAELSAEIAKAAARCGVTL